MLRRPLLLDTWAMPTFGCCGLYELGVQSTCSNPFSILLGRYIVFHLHECIHLRSEGRLDVTGVWGQRLASRAQSFCPW